MVHCWFVRVRYATLRNWHHLEYIAEKAMAPHSSTLAWKIPWAEEPGRLQSMGLDSPSESAHVSIHTYYTLFLQINTLLASLLSSLVGILFCKWLGFGALTSVIWPQSLAGELKPNFKPLQAKATRNYSPPGLGHTAGKEEMIWNQGGWG